MMERLRNVKAGLVLEGGATRGVFTAGALDYLMEREFMFPYVVGVSAGACNALSYAAGQIGRSLNCLSPEREEDRYLYSWREAIAHKSMYDMDKLFVTFPKETFPFDYAAYKRLNITCELVVTNVLTGKAEYMTETENEERLCDICRASSSLPMVAPMVYLDGIPYLDGGLSDSIPLARAVATGHRKNVVISTRPYGYRKKFPDESMRMYIPLYRKYPELVKDIYFRPYYYNKRMEKIERLESAGKIFVLRPSMECPKKKDIGRDKLQGFYEHGYEEMKKEFDRMAEFLEVSL